ncbi:Calcineurin-like phosphoesterase [Flavobacteriaceae bacterium MAR_2010_188]|nr:Calcineurin-like phosphoesterase [Flavobacteriaceae bacterium MAR_2010_188]
MTNSYYYISCALILLILASCATRKSQYKNEQYKAETMPDKEVDRRFYLIGDAGISPLNAMSNAITAFKQHIEEKNTERDYALFLGDNIYPVGMPDSTSAARPYANNSMDAQINSVKEFKGRSLFIPGNHDWYSQGIVGLKREEQYVEKALGKDSFLPQNGCPLESISVSDSIQLIVIDSQWYLENWNHHPTINDNCEIKTRERFLEELEGEMKDARKKTIVFAMHHPMFTNGNHGGEFSIDKHLYPIQKKIPMPGLASLVMQVRTQGGVSIQDRYNERYNSLMKRIKTLAIDNGNLIFVSGHEHTLQYIESEEGLKQIVSGSGSKSSAASLKKNGQFTSGEEGFAEFTVFKDGSSWVSVYGNDNGDPVFLFQKEAYPPKVGFDYSNLPTTFPNKVEASIYTKQETDVSNFYESVLGDRYREIYGTKITVPVATLDTLYGGVEIVKQGGGHQTRSLRLKRKDGRELNMRALRKSATQYIQTVLFKENYVEDAFEQTAIEDLILDFYTAAHPYAFLTIPALSDAAGLYSTHPKLYYVPKHPYLGEYNSDFGDELYMIEERPEDNYTDEKTFGFADDIESTYDIIEKVREDEKYKIDEEAYVRARLFDMLVGDWDRHADQWRWAQFDQPNGDKLYRPIPRDRDQVFSNFDGALLDLMRAISGSTKQLQVYDAELSDVQWINAAGVKLDRILIQQAQIDTWLEQAKYLTENITDEVIEKAFANIPKEVQDKNLEEIKEKLKGRRANMVDIATRYYKYLSSLVILTGTDKDDYIEVTRVGDEHTNVKISRIKDGEKGEVIVDRTLDRNLTRDLWIYGLDDDDIFVVDGKANNLIYTRLIGGLGNDTYRLKNGRRIKVYDHESKENFVEVNNGGQIKRTDVYNLNIFDFTKNIQKKGGLSPNAGYNPDDGVYLGLQVSKRRDGFQRNPFSQLHVIDATYAFATGGIDVHYNGEFANIFNDWNLELQARFTSQDYAENFFGYGNETPNFDEEKDFDFNRVNISYATASAGVLKKADFGSSYSFRTIFDGIQVDDDPGKFINDYVSAEFAEFYQRKYFGAVEAAYNYHSADSENNTTQGMDFNLAIGGRTNLEQAQDVYAFIDSDITFYNALTLDKKLVLRTNVFYKQRFGNNYEFYQAANIGGDNGLRGYRNERFTGKTSLAGGADVRYVFNTIKTKTLPLQIGIYGGADLGRVWVRDFNSKVWHSDYGGGLWITAAHLLQGRVNVFTGDEGVRFSVGFGANF